MTNLNDPNLPPGEIVEKRDDGIWVRNDGVELSPASSNPYYVMATICGEQGATYDKELAAKNRRFRNGWACADMSDDERYRIAGLLGLHASDLAPLTPTERSLVARELKARSGSEQPIPKPNYFDLSGIYFLNTVVWGKYCFSAGASFITCHFAEYANFVKVHFLRGAYFYSAHLTKGAYFGAAHFSVYTNFNDTHFAGDVFFENAHFGGYADFNATHFAEYAIFDTACFAGNASFRAGHFSGYVSFVDGFFEGPTDFRYAQFEGTVPRFEQREFHDKTNFTQTVVGRDGSRYWPKVPEDRDEAEDDKDAYRRLRQVSANQHNPEAEHFFLRQEMACDAVLKEDWLSRFIVRAFGWISSYGYSVWRPVAGLFATWIVGSLLILTIFAWAIVDGVPPEGMKRVPGEMEAFGLGFANTFAIFGFRSYYLGEAYMIALPVFVKFIGGTQTVLGFIFLFFLGLGLRNRFRLK